MDKSETRPPRPQAGFDKAQKKAAEGAAALADHQAQARAVDEKTARLKGLRLARDAGAPQAEGKFKTPPRRKAQPVKKVAVSAEARKQYEDVLQEREERHRAYGAHLPGDKRR